MCRGELKIAEVCCVCVDQSEGPLLLCRVEFLCHDINVHVPHHVNSKIPWYNLRAATDSLRQNWGQVRNILLIVPSMRHTLCISHQFNHQDVICLGHFGSLHLFT